MNPRVSRSSALASKATGFPIAKVAAKLAVGYTLDEIANDITGGATPASFEPTIDYVVTKIPRFAFEKFPGRRADPDHGDEERRRGDGDRPHLRRIACRRRCARWRPGSTASTRSRSRARTRRRAERISAALGRPTPDRLLIAAQALRHGMSRDEIHAHAASIRGSSSGCRRSSTLERACARTACRATAGHLRRLKAAGFSDARLAALAGNGGGRSADAAPPALGVRPVYKRIDTCAAEFASPTAYMYSTYGAAFGGTPVDEAQPTDARKIVILGGGPNRIGQGIEFDYCCCHACFALTEAGYETIMINCNPETVSTDYDTSDRLYFEPLTAEDVLDILRSERQAGTLDGVIVQFGGQTPLKLAPALEEAGIPILGTSPDAIDLAEDRDRFKRLLDKLGLKQPKNGIA